MQDKINFKEKVFSKEYDFLHQLPLKDNVILMVASGSYGYGTNIGTSDIDFRGVCIEPKESLLGFKQFEQFEELKTDTVIYGIKKFLQLCLNANPNCLEILGAHEENIVILFDLGQTLLDNKHLFLSKRVVQSFGNYATAQLRRLQNALARDSYPQIEKETHILNALTRQLDHFSRMYSAFDDNEIKLYIDDSAKDGFEKEIFMDINLVHYLLRDFKNIHSEMSNVVKDYEKLNHRNRKKDDFHLNKHAMHLIRLLLTGIDILEGKGINTYRKEEKNFLLDNRNGRYTYPEIFKLVDDYELRFEEAARNTTLPNEPDHVKTEQLMMETYEKFLKIR
ncbi:MAG TPA: nucleotidyltransferase [Clostridiales bacterium]|nr:MAG: nucleotidyltransferase [Clostridiales bacterium GWD2_32_19]HCC06825.1 nucleotidyltransferase [Clostridiales bacterium]